MKLEERFCCGCGRDYMDFTDDPDINYCHTCIKNGMVRG